MRRAFLDALAAPTTGEPLCLEQVDSEMDGEIYEGLLVAPDGRTFPILGGIPRFVPGEGYAANFGLQWQRYRETQLDSRTGLSLSTDRLYAGTGWTRDELVGARVLEVGCGAGRFTEVLLAAGAEVVSIEYSQAVDACWLNHGPHPRLHLAQADLYALPFRPGSFDKVFCFGVLQHTPDIAAAFRALLPWLRPGGQLAIDVYRRPPRRNRYTSKYLWRPLTTRMAPEKLLRLVEWYVPRWLPIDDRLRRIPRWGRLLVSLVPCWNYRDIFPLSPQQLRAWAILDTFDALSARYDAPQTLADVEAWFAATDLVDVVVRPGGNGIVATATAPLADAPRGGG